MKAIILCKETQIGSAKGTPDIGTGYSGFVYVGPLVANVAVYVITGTAGQLTTIQAHINCVGGLLITDNGVRWPEMAQAVPAALRTKINTYRAANALTPIGAGVTLLQVVRFAATHFDGAGNFDCFDPDVS